MRWSGAMTCRRGLQLGLGRAGSCASRILEADGRLELLAGIDDV